MNHSEQFAGGTPTPRVSHPRTVRAPVSTDGIGLALRCAYLPRANDLPHDLAKLLDVLDR